MTLFVTTTEGAINRHDGGTTIEMGDLQDLRILDGDTLIAAYAPGKWVSAVREEDKGSASYEPKCEAAEQVARRVEALLAQWQAETGWGDGQARAAALRAVLR